MDRRTVLKGVIGAPILMQHGALGASTVQAADDWPTRNITVIVPFPPGGQADMAARPIAAALEKSLGRSVVVENRGGAGGAVGNAAVARADPDGHTLLVTLPSVLVLPEADRLFGRKPSYEVAQLEPVARILADPMVLAVPAGAPWRTVQELIEAAKKQPSEIPYGSSGTYGASHVSMEMFTAAAGIKLLHVPYRGGAPSLTGLLAGQVQASGNSPGTVKPHVDAGTLRIIATWGEERFPMFPDAPTFKELGLKDVVFYNWAGLFAPKGVPPGRLDRLRTAIRTSMRDPEIVKGFEQVGTAPAYLDAPEFTVVVQEDSARLKLAVEKIGKVE